MKWTEQEVADLKLGVAILLPYKEVAEILGKSYGSIRDKASRLGLKKPANLGTYAYIQRLPKDIKSLEEYIDTKAKILHKHNCGHEWRVAPHDILRGNSCPACADSSFKLGKPAMAYLIHFYALGIYKVGITNRTVKKRFLQEEQPYEVILERYFEKGSKAKELETIWLSNLKPFLYNTNELKDGNTETFIYD